MNKIQKRVGLTANIISNMKQLKISGLAVPVEELIQNMRVDELQAASRFRTVNVIVIVFGYVPLALAPVITFAVTSRALDATTIFTSISYLLLLTDPLSYLFQNSPNLLAAFACFERIQTFLEKDPRVDFRTLRLHIPDTELEKYGSSSEEKESDPEPLVTIANGNFGWETNKTILKNINLEIPSSRLTMVVGPVASGKSTLCKVLLGEIPEYQAQITMHHSIASRRVGYCDQTPYLSNASIRANIIGFSPFNQQRYKEVIEATMLEPDLAVLPKGDATITGSSGIALSGGQKQRVSVARALYLHTDFFVFDDILSGIDAITEEKVFTRIFGLHGLLRRRNATVVLCTNTASRLPFANHIVALGMDGSIVEQGSFQKLLTNRKYVHDLGFEATDDIILEQSYYPIEAEESTGTEVRKIAIGQPVTQSLTDEKKRMNGDSAVYMYYMKSLGKRSIATFLIFGVGWGFSYNFGNIWLTYWAKDIGSAHPRRTNSLYIGIYTLFQLLYLSSLLFSFMVCYRTMVRVSGSKLHKAALNTVINAPLRFFATTDTGLVTNLFSQDMTLIDNEMPVALTNLVLDSFNALGMAAVIATSSPFLAITYPFLFAILYWIQKFYLRTSRQVRLLDLEAKGPL
jgi:ABC-type multidrug transport system fused ATPase/permease subunit